MSGRKRMVWIGLLFVVVAGGVIAMVWARQARSGRPSKTMRLLASSEPEDRKRGAWRSVSHHERVAEAEMLRGLEGAEAIADVRETYVYALGKLEDEEFFPTVQLALENDASGYVRAAAWLAAARIDRHRTADLLVEKGTPIDAWDRIGHAQARLMCGDVSVIEDLLELAEDGNPTQRLVASRALYKSLQPLLDAAGLWPIALSVPEGQTWPPPLIERVRDRCRQLPLQQVAMETLYNVKRAARVRKNVYRITSARDRIANVLFGRWNRDESETTASSR